MMEAIRDQISTLLEVELRSLCSTCTHRPTCSYRQQSKKLIIQCELFSTTTPVASPVLQELRPVVKRNARGLCDTCVHQRTCSFFLRNGYVWHCEEFA